MVVMFDKIYDMKVTSNFVSHVGKIVPSHKRIEFENQNKFQSVLSVVF